MEKKMANRDIVLTIIVLLGIAWLLFENYHKGPTEAPKPKTVEQPAK